MKIRLYQKYGSIIFVVLYLMLASPADASAQVMNNQLKELV
jgi:hypothetical protein